MELAKKLNAADEFIELSRTNPDEQFEKLKKDNPYGCKPGRLGSRRTKIN
jgi:D-arabinitol dehydrogenase (NADP+)